MALRNNEYIKKVAVVFKNRRLALELTQQNIADACEMTVMSYNKIENGNVDIRLSTLHELLKTLRIIDPFI